MTEEPTNTEQSRVAADCPNERLVMLQAARGYAAKIDDEIAEHAFDEDFGFADHVTEEDKRRYADDHRKHAEEIRAGKHDHNFTVWQRMHFFLTGECAPFLPKI